MKPLRLVVVAVATVWNVPSFSGSCWISTVSSASSSAGRTWPHTRTLPPPARLTQIGIRYAAKPGLRRPSRNRRPVWKAAELASSRSSYCATDLDRGSCHAIQSDWLSHCD